MPAHHERSAATILAWQEDQACFRAKSRDKSEWLLQSSKPVELEFPNQIGDCHFLTS
jgi:hypothetical protein